jgi:signal transduction histidine kinase
MKVAKRSFLPHGIASQIIILLILSAIIFHLCMTAAAFLGRPGHELGPPPGPVEQLVRLVKLVDAAPINARSEVIAWIRDNYPWLDLREGSAAAAPADSLQDAASLSDGQDRLPADDWQTRSTRDVVQQSNGAALRVFRPGTGADPDRVGFRLGDGSSFTAFCPHCTLARLDEALAAAWSASANRGGPGAGRPPPGPPTEPMVIASLFAIAISFTLFLLWVARSVTMPLRRFAAAVDAFSIEGNMTPLSESGPVELRTAAHALNRMRDRIKGMIEERTRMLAAIGHDLRTPITRMRLRAEFIEPREVRDAILRDLEQMNAMAHSALSFIRDGVDVQRSSLLDLGTLLQTVRDEFADMGFEVSFEKPDPVSIEGNPEELHRALTNLVDNGVTYGKNVTIGLRRLDADRIEIEVADDGPGIPDAKKSDMLAPFVRGGDARKSNRGQGYGLGLPIVQAIVAAHKGSFDLVNRQPNGLIARIILPLRQPR